MYMRHSDKLAKALGYLTKHATQMVDPALNVMEAGTAGYGLYGANQARTAGQTAAQVVNRFAQPFGATPLGQTAGRAGMLGRGLGAIALPLAAVGTYGAAQQHIANARDYKAHGQRYAGSEDSIWDTLDTASAAAPLVGAGVGAGLGAGVGALPGAAIGSAVGLGLQGVKAVGQGLTGFDSQKNRAARANVSSGGYGNAQEYLAQGLYADQTQDRKSFTSTSWLGKKRDFGTENLNKYLEQQRTNRIKSQTNQNQVA
jgi:hypothetical protein